MKSPNIPLIQSYFKQLHIRAINTSTSTPVPAKRKIVLPDGKIPVIHSINIEQYRQFVQNREDHRFTIDSRYISTMSTPRALRSIKKERIIFIYRQEQLDHIRQ
jgi:dihydroorotase